MSRSSSDAWFVRLPDDRVVRANSTRSVRHHIENGTFPPGSSARRSPRESWIALHRLEPFADLLPDNAASRRNQRAVFSGEEETNGNTDTLMQLQAGSVRGLWTELAKALDCTWTRRKLFLAGGTCLLFGLLFLAQELALNQLVQPWALVGMLGQGLIVLLAGAACAALLTQMTFIELSQLRPATLREGAQNLSFHMTRLVLCYLIVFGSIGGVLYLAHWLPTWLPPGEDIPLVGRELLLSAIVVLQILLEVFLLPLFGFALLLGPIVLIEEISTFRALGQWCGLVRTHLRRLFLYEALAAIVALVAVMPFLVPVVFAAQLAPPPGQPGGLAALATLTILAALACAPGFAYLIVANVFIYLHLRYELPSTRSL